MGVFGSNSCDLFQNLFIVEFIIVSTFEIQHPALYLTSLAVNIYKFFDGVQHAKMFSFECSFNRQYSMTESSDLSSLFMHIFHYFVNNYQRVYLGVLRVDFDENKTLIFNNITFTFVST